MKTPIKRQKEILGKFQALKKSERMDDGLIVTASQAREWINFQFEIFQESGDLDLAIWTVQNLLKELHRQDKRRQS